MNFWKEKLESKTYGGDTDSVVGGVVNLKYNRELRNTAC